MGKRETDDYIIPFSPLQITVLREVLEQACSGIQPGTAASDASGLARRIALQAIEDITNTIDDVTG